MKRIFLAATLIAGLGAARAAEPADFTGRWEISAKAFGQPALYDPASDGRLVIARQAGRYTGTYNGLTFSGDLRADGLHLSCPGDACGDLVLTVAGDALGGSGTIAGTPVTLTGKRPAPRPAPRTHDFTPKDYKLWFSGATAPVLRVFPGDSIRTRTVDAKGFDEHHIGHSQHGNPQVGPFFVEGAMPGDTLVVHLNRIRINRDTALQADTIFPSAFDPDYLKALPKVPPGGHNIWKLDAKSGTATLAAPSDRLKHFTVAMAPMLGCVGVAPPMGDRLQSHHLGPFGGNMDYSEVREGNTLYLPVYQRGALLYFGDAHAQQGDAELTGQGLETSMDVEVSVDVIENKALNAPRLEDKDSVMIMGIGPSLDAAFKAANTQMATWLTATYHLSAPEVAIVLGTEVSFQIAEVVDPEFNIVAKIRKDALAKIAKP